MNDQRQLLYCDSHYLIYQITQLTTLDGAVSKIEASVDPVQ
jgi:hypothetical protein